MEEGQMTTEQAQLLSALQQINQRLGDQQNQITQLQAAQTRVRGESELSGMVPTAQLVQDAIQMANAGNSSSSNSRDPGVTIDTRQIGKPEQFKSDPAEYSDWSFVFKAYMSCISTNYIGLFERIEASRVPMPNRLLDANDKALSAQLYYVLAMLVKGRALDIIQNSGPGEGVEAFKKLEETYHPKVASRFVGSLTLILSTRFSSDIESELELFEKNIRRYEQESGKTLDDEILLGVVINGLQDNSMRDHIIRNSSRLTTYQLVRTELLEIARTSRVLNQMPVPMEIGGVPKGKTKGKGQNKGPKGKGKSNDQKGSSSKGKGQGQSGHKGENPNKDKECHYCHRKGHLKADCRVRIRDEKNKSGKGSKPKGNAAIPEEEPQGEPLSATVDQDELDSFVAGAIDSKKWILVDSGAGSHLFTKDFDPHSQSRTAVHRNNLVTVTGEPLVMGDRKKSLIEADSNHGDSCNFTIEYDESEKMKFSVLSAGKAADAGVWTIIGTNVQCMVRSNETQNINKFLKKLDTIPLIKKRGVFWLPAKLREPAGSSAVVADGPASEPLLGALKAAKKAVPAKLIEEEAGERVQLEREGLVSSGSRDQDPNPDDSLPQDEVAVPRGEVQVEASEEGRKPRAKKIPENVSQEEFHMHMLTHIPMRSWCDHCVKGKIREDDHKPRVESKDPNAVPRVCMDYCFLGRVVDGSRDVRAETGESLKTPTEEQESAIPVLVITDEKTGCVFSGVVTKGVNPYAVHLVVEALKFLGRQRVILFTDSEPSIKALAEAVSKEFKGEVQLMASPRESHASNGLAERAILEIAKQSRTLVSAVESRFPGFKLQPSEKHLPWLVRAAAWLLTRYLIKKDGKTPYERLRGRSYNGEVAEPFEFVHFKISNLEKGKLDSQTSSGIWLGKTLTSDEHLIASEKGVRRCRSIWRMPEGKRWNIKAFEGWTGLPWQPRGSTTPMPGTPALPPVPGTPVPTTPGGGKRGVYITVGLQIKHGATPGCPGCHCSDDNPKPHNKECRSRFEEIVRKEKAEAAPEQQRTADVEMGSEEAQDAGGSANAGGTASAGGSAQAGGSASQSAGGSAQAGGSASQGAGGTALGPPLEVAMREAPRPEPERVAPHRQKSRKRPKEQGQIHHHKCLDEERQKSLWKAWRSR